MNCLCDFETKNMVCIVNINNLFIIEIEIKLNICIFVYVVYYHWENIFTTKDKKYAEFFSLLGFIYWVPSTIPAVYSQNFKQRSIRWAHFCIILNCLTFANLFNKESLSQCSLSKLKEKNLVQIRALYHNHDA